MEEHMSRKTKRHKNQGNSNNQGTETVSSVQKGTEQIQSALKSVGETASNNKLLLSLIGVGAGIAGASAFLLKTERGQAIQEQVGETITDSMGRIRELAVDGWCYVRDFVTESGVDTDELM